LVLLITARIFSFLYYIFQYIISPFHPLQNPSRYYISHGILKSVYFFNSIHKCKWCRFQKQFTAEILPWAKNVASTENVAHQLSSNIIVINDRLFFTVLVQGFFFKSALSTSFCLKTHQCSLSTCRS
ncbi:hypothetical protein T09_2380, partial [Trichinella sp. T9]